MKEIISCLLVICILFVGCMIIKVQEEVIDRASLINNNPLKVGSKQDFEIPHKWSLDFYDFKFRVEVID